MSRLDHKRLDLKKETGSPALGNIATKPDSHLLLESEVNLANTAAKLVQGRR
jgi:hypothetical protein